ncbi:hypothetical protein [uncultured Dysosmobacter sp.]|uniref:hypothetical protein n=1 Tax=uncultured Dysosmobacter sp. TaxID=2591384 RepID=UPI00261EAF5B|nr:hypothetical protein [uncultured Dysosmobacter sp.]
MVDFEMLSATTQKAALEKVTRAANSGKQASPQQLAQVFSDIVVSAIQEYDRQVKS